MAPQPVVLKTSWLRVEGPQDARTCAHCRSWGGRLLPLEMQAEYARGHRADHACRCRLMLAELKADPEDPDCAWA